MSAFINRTLGQIRSDLEFLRDENVITAKLFDTIDEFLPKSYTSGDLPLDIKKDQVLAEKAMSSTSSIASQPIYTESIADIKKPPTSQYSVVQRPVCIAQYNYRSEDPGDLDISVNDRIEILEEINPDWWKGSCNGRLGIFPSNYVNKLDPASSSASAPPAYSVILPEHTADEKSQKLAYPLPVTQSPQQYQMMQPQQAYPFPAPQQQFAPVQQQFPADQVVQQPQQNNGNGNKIGKVASNVGKNFANSVVFGAGASVGSKIVNSIF